MRYGAMPYFIGVVPYFIAWGMSWVLPLQGPSVPLLPERALRSAENFKALTNVDSACARTRLVAAKFSRCGVSIGRVRGAGTGMEPSLGHDRCGSL